MKKFLLISFLFPLILSFSNAELIDVDPCYLSNQNDLYVGPSLITVDIPECPGCFFTFQYYWRESGNFKDVQITAWELHANSDESCLNCDFSYLIAAALRAIWNYNVMGWEKYDPINGWCHWQFSASIYSCMEYSPIYDPPDVIDDGKSNIKNNKIHDLVRTYYPCSSTCCAAAYEVCYDPVTALVVSIEYLSFLSYSSVCDSQNPNCEPVCDHLMFEYPTEKFNNDLDQNKSLLKTNDNEKYDSLYFVPNPTNNSGEIHLSSKNNGTLELVVFNELGFIVLNRIIEKSNYEILIPIDLKDFNTGKYSYKIVIDNNESYTDHFIIFK